MGGGCIKPCESTSTATIPRQKSISTTLRLAPLHYDTLQEVTHQHNTPRIPRRRRVKRKRRIPHDNAPKTYPCSYGACYRRFDNEQNALAHFFCSDTHDHLRQ